MWTIFARNAETSALFSAVRVAGTSSGEMERSSILIFMLYFSLANAIARASEPSLSASAISWLTVETSSKVIFRSGSGFLDGSEFTELCCLARASIVDLGARMPLNVSALNGLLFLNCIARQV